MNKMDGEILRKGFISAYQNLEAHKEEVNALNVFPVPDGDTGTNMSLTMRSAAKQLNQLEDVSVEAVVKAVSSGSLMGARGNSGVILSQILRGFAVGTGSADTIDVPVLKDAFVSSYQTAYKAVMKPTEGTMLTVIREMGEFAEKNFEEYEDVYEFLNAILEEGKKSLENTPNLLPVLKESGVVDAGGKGIIYIFEGIIHYDKAPERIKEINVEKTHSSAHLHHDEDIKFGYCTEFMIHSEKSFEEYRDILSTMGDSLIVVGADGLIKTHIHTNNPGEVLEEGMKLGSLTDIKIDNMRVQHQHLLATEEELKSSEEVVEFKKYGFISVSTGKGLDEIFRELNIDKIISGGQTMNPSTEDIVNSINDIHAENIFVFPNNKNIILTAKQAKEFSDKNIIVIETRSIPEAYASILAFDEDLDPEENEENMKEAMDEVKTAQITYSVRDTSVEGVQVKKGDYLCILDGKIISSSPNLDKVFKDLCEQAIDDDVSIVTMYSGEDSEEVMTDSLKAYLEENFDDIDITVVDGKQPVYSYIISFE